MTGLIITIYYAIMGAPKSRGPVPLNACKGMKPCGSIRWLMCPGIRARLVAGALVALATSASAVPYASGVTNSGGKVSFILNESAAEVKVVLSGGPGGATNLGACAKGTHSFNLGGNTAFSIQVSNSAPSGWTVSSQDTNPLVRFYSPRGVAVNCNPTNLSTFGRIYVSTANVGKTIVIPTNSSRFTGRGIYILNSDQTDTFGQGTNARTAGIAFDTSGEHRFHLAHNSPWRIALGPDGCLYVCDYSIETGTLYRTDPDATTNVMVLQGQGRDGNPLVHTTISGVYVEGSLEQSNLVVYANDGGWAMFNAHVTNGFIGLMRYRIGAGPVPWNTPPDRLAPAEYGSLAQRIYDVDRGPDGKFYISVYREEGDIAALRIFDGTGTNELWNSDPGWGYESEVGPLQLRGIALSHDGSQLALVRPDYYLWLLPLTNGIPDLSRMRPLNIFGGRWLPPKDACMDGAFDAAGNLYAASAGPEKLRILSPGGLTTAITAFDGTNGSFTLLRQESAPELTLTLTMNTISEGGPPAAFVVGRLGETSQPLTVFYRLSGTASNGLDYTNLPGAVVIPAGASSTRVYLNAIADGVSEPTETAMMVLAGTTNSPLGLGAPRATVTILDRDTLEVVITGLHTNIYEGDTNDLATIHVARLGDLDQPTGIGLDWLGGTAAPGQDYLPLPYPVPLESGVDYAVAQPLNDTQIEGPEYFSFRLLPDPWSQWLVGTNIVTCVIREDAAEGVPLFAENFENPAAVTNWALKFAARGGLDDYRAEFGWRYGCYTNYSSIPPAPHSGAGLVTRGLYATVNKFGTNDLGSGAGLNLYPVGPTFTGDFALRFDMYLWNEGGGPTTEHAIFGINHSGLQTNWFRLETDGSPGAAYDGLWFQVSADGAGYGDYVLNTGPAVVANGMTSPTILASRSARSLSDVFPPAGTVADRWVDVEVSELEGVVTLKINNAPILCVTNSTTYTGGRIMLGYDDPFDSWGWGSFVLYDNVRVYRLAANIVPVAAVLLSESCAPANGAMDPGETVTLNFTLQNVGLANTTNLVATLLPTGGVTSASVAQTYGPTTPGEAGVTRSFTFTANGACGGTVAATLQLQDGATDLGMAVVNLPLGHLGFATNVENFDSVVAPALPPGWTSSVLDSATHWATEDWLYDTVPNAVMSLTSGSIADNRLTSPPFALSSPSQLSFRHQYSFPGSGSGGAVLEISVNGGDFQDIVDAGGSFVTNGYNGMLAGYKNPLAQRDGWTGSSGDFVTTVVNLPPTPAGANAQLRWRLGSGETDGGQWFLDSVSVLNGSYSCCAASLPLTIGNACVQGGDLLFSFQSLTGRTYEVEYKNTLTDTNWALLQSVLGDGSLLTISNTMTVTQRFYRLRVP
jgi:hypothetical protein